MHDRDSRYEWRIYQLMYRKEAKQHLSDLLICDTLNLKFTLDKEKGKRC